MTTFDPQTTLDDFVELGAIVEHFWSRVSHEAWERRTGERDKDWTLRQALCHLVAIATLFNRTIDAAVEQTTVHFDGFTQRADLRAWNKAEIVRRAHIAPEDLIVQLLTALDNAAERAQSLTPQQADMMYWLPVYNRAFCALDYIDFQLSHVGVIHAAQVTRPFDNQPLWTHYSPALLYRQIDRFLRQFSAAYWPEVGGDLHAAINFYVDGESGGAWHIIAAPDGGSVGAGADDEPLFALHFSEPAVLFGIFTVHLPFTDALTSGHMQIEGDGREAAHILRLFSASPPRA